MLVLMLGFFSAKNLFHDQILTGVIDLTILGLVALTGGLLTLHGRRAPWLTYNKRRRSDFHLFFFTRIFSYYHRRAASHDP
ncbi:MAG: hypothetical protein ACKO15_04055 [Burkholderiales bacterium]